MAKGMTSVPGVIFYTTYLVRLPGRGVRLRSSTRCNSDPAKISALKQYGMLLASAMRTTRVAERMSLEHRIIRSRISTPVSGPLARGRREAREITLPTNTPCAELRRRSRHNSKVRCKRMRDKACYCAGASLFDKKATRPKLQPSTPLNVSTGSSKRSSSLRMSPSTSRPSSSNIRRNTPGRHPDLNLGVTHWSPLQNATLRIDVSMSKPSGL